MEKEVEKLLIELIEKKFDLKLDELKI